MLLMFGQINHCCKMQIVYRVWNLIQIRAHNSHCPPFYSARLLHGIIIFVFVQALLGKNCLQMVSCPQAPPFVAAFSSSFVRGGCCTAAVLLPPDQCRPIQSNACWTEADSGADGLSI
jgi:hypothetical protein